MRNTIKKLSLIALCSVFALCLAFIALFATGDRTPKSAKAAAATTEITLAINGETGSVDLIPGDTFELSVTIHSTRPTIEWAAVSVYLGPISSENTTTMDSTMCNWFSFDYGDVGTAFMRYNDNSTDKFSTGLGLLLSIGSPTQERYLVNTNTDFTWTTELTLSSSANKNFTFGMQPMLLNKVSYGNGTTIDYANTDAISWNNIDVSVGVASDVAALKEVKVGHGSADTVIGTGTTDTPMSTSLSYTGNSADLSNFTVQATELDKGATIKIGTTANPTTVATSGSPLTVPLSSAPATIYIVVTSEDGSNTETYQISYKSSYARLSGLAVTTNSPTTGTTKNGLSATFNKDTYSYTVYVPSDATTVSVTPTVAANYGISTTVAVSATGCTAGSSVASGSALSVTGANTGTSLTLTVTAGDSAATKATYTLTFTQVSVDTSITSFTMTGNDDNVVYNTDTTQTGADYYFALPYESGYKGKFNITAGSSAATIKVGTAAYSSATVYNAGTYTVTVTAEAGNTKSYTVTVVQHVVSADFTSLKYSTTGADAYIDVKSAAEYDSSTHTFTKKINVSSITATTPRIYIGATETAGATVTVTGLSTNSVTSSEKNNYYGNLTIGENTFTLNASSSAGNMTYKFVITYVEENNTISKIELKNGTTALEGFTFDPATTTYNITVPYSLSSVTATVTPEGKYAYVYRDSDTYRLTTNTYTCSLAVGNNTFKLYAKADNGLGDKGTEYTITISRTAASTDVLLKSLTVTVDGDVATLSPVFDSATNTYTVNVDNDTFSLSIAAQASSDLASVTGELTNVNTTLGTGATSHTITKTVTVKAESGATNSYTITFVRDILSADFTSLKFSTTGADAYIDVKTAAEYDASTHTFTKKINVSEITATPARIYIGGSVTRDATGSQTGLTVNSVTGGETYNYYADLKIGTNTYTVKATSTAGNMTYTFVISYVEENNKISNIELKDGTTALEGFTFDPATTSYTVTVPFSLTSVVATVTPDGKYSYVYRDSDANRLTTNSYTRSLSVGDNTFKLYAKADNGLGDKGTEYTITISRTAASSDVLLKSLTVTVDGTVATLSPVFDSGTNAYTVNVDNDTFSLAIAAEASSDLATVTGTFDATNTTLGTGATSHTITKTVTVKSESGATNSYTITFVRDILAADFTSLKFSASGVGSYSDVFTAAEYDASTHTFTKKFNVSDFTSSPARIYIGGSVTRDATGSQTGLTVNSVTNDETYNYYADLKLGTNTYTLSATSTAGNMTYTFVITYVEENNKITDIALTNNSTALDGFTFNPATSSYTITVPYSISSVTVAVTTEGKYSYVYCDSDTNKLTQNTTTLAHMLTRNLSVGDNTFKLYAKADNGLGDKGTEYTFTITRQPMATDATLKSLVVTSGGTTLTLSPSFDPDTLVYTIFDDSDSLTLNIAAEANNSSATVSGTGTKTISPSIAGSDTVNSFTVTVTAEDGTALDYVIYVSKNPVVLNSNYDITSITIVGNDGVTYYSSEQTPLVYGNMPTITVPYLVERVVITAKTAFPTTTLNGKLDTQELIIGSNEFTIFAVAEDGTNSDGANSYIFTIIREEPIENVSLRDLQISDSTVSGFNPEIFDYSIRVDSDVPYVSVRAIADEARAQISIQVGGQVYGSGTGTAYAPVVLMGDKGESVTVIINVTIDDKIATYNVRITRSSDKPVLSSLQVGAYDIYNADGEVIDGMDESVVSKMDNFYVRVDYSNVNDIIMQATTNDLTAEVRISGDIISSGAGFCSSQLKMQDLYDETGAARVQVVVIPPEGEVAVYYVYFVFLSGNTNALITIDEITSFNEQYRIDNPSIVYGNYKIAYTLPELTIGVQFEVDEGFAEGTYQIYYNTTLKNDNGTEVSPVKLNYGVNYICVNLTSSDGRVTKTIVVLVEREAARLETVSIDEIEAFATDYNGDQTEYSYTVGNKIGSLNIHVTVAEGYTYEISDADLKTGSNRITIYIFEQNNENAKSAVAAKTASAIEDNALRVIHLNVFREQAVSSLWKILFYVFAGLSLLLLLIIILMLIFRPRKKEEPAQVQPQQAPIIINTPPVAQPQPQPQPQIIQAPPQYVQPQIIQAPPQYVQPQVIQAPPQYIQAPQQPQYQQPAQQPVVQPIIINTTTEKRKTLPEQTSIPTRRVIVKNGNEFYDVDGFYENGDDKHN